MSATTAAAPRYRPAALDRLLAARVAINWEITLYALIFALAFALRFWDLGTRALHHDESIHAQWSWDLLRGNYRHSPIFHGPFYYHVEALVFFLFGSNDYTARVSAAVFGTALLFLPLLFRKRLGAVGTLSAVALLAFSPTLVYYSRFFREDIYMAFFILLMAVAMWRFIEEDRERWLFVFAAAFTGAVTTKEGSFLVFAVFLIYLDVYLAAQLAHATLQARELNTTPRRLLMTLAYSPWAWAVAAFWPFLGSFRKNLDWPEKLPRSGDILVILGTFTLPLLTPIARPILEKLGVVATDIPITGGTAGVQKFTSRLNWEFHLSTNITMSDRFALAGLFAVTTSAAAFVGLQWRARTWAVAFSLSTLVYLTLMTSFWTNLNGLVSGPWGSIDYWRTQQDVYRGDQPWYYFFLLFPAYEFLPLAICVGGIWWSTVRGNAFSRFLVVWLVGQFLVFSWGSEKMPWLNTHLAVPACLLAAWTINRAWQAWRPSPRLNAIATPLISILAIAAGSLAVVAFLPGGTAWLLLRCAIAVGAVALITWTARPFGRGATGTVLVVAAVGALAFFSLRSMIEVSFTRGDVPKDMLIYTQSSPDIPRLMTDIEQLAAATGKGYNLPIAVDSTDSYSWPWAWYLRDYKCVSYADFTSGPPRNTTCQGSEQPFAVMLVNNSNKPKTDDAIAQGAVGGFGTPEKYPHRWWFPENYKDAVNVDGQACTAQFGDCGPFVMVGPVPVFPKVDTWSTIIDGFVHHGWLNTWLLYWRDHDPDEIYTAAKSQNGDDACNSCGSTDAWAYFPANFDMATGKLSARTVEAPKPTVDKAGRPQFGSFGAGNGQFIAPVDIEKDAAGNLYVIDSRTRKLQKFDPNGNFLAAADIRVDPSSATEASQPWGLAVAPDGTVAVADTFGWRVRLFDSNLKPTGVTFGQPPAQTDKAPGPYDLYGPRDVAFDAQGNLWVTDTGDARIAIYDRAGKFLRQVGGTKGSGPGQFDEPVGIDIASDGTVFVADMFNARVVLLTPDGAYQSSFPVDGWGSHDVNDKPYLRALPDGRVAVSLPGVNQVRVYDRAGNLQGNVTAADEPLSRPYGIVATSDGKLWIAEGGAARVREFPLPKTP